jgi:hypothetical protein
MRTLMIDDYGSCTSNLFHLLGEVNVRAQGQIRRRLVTCRAAARRRKEKPSGANLMIGDVVRNGPRPGLGNPSASGCRIEVVSQPRPR